MSRTNWNRPTDKIRGRPTESLQGSTLSGLIGSTPRQPQKTKAQLRAEAEAAFKNWGGSAPVKTVMEASPKARPASMKKGGPDR